ncbi:unnamed protein product [Ceutorhynchus assimilis]|uniref:Uncharacterized protein n=1 Tax=Ceutorhynchus assimilis TaxID=467358 RepID=A0A9N9MR60_9CUCU|nr:unnamed protein product [Ceutorhynchus assimilis]
MVSICGKKFACTREKLLLSDIQAKKEAKDFERFLQELKEKREQSQQSNNVRVLSGTTVPNSTFKSRISSDVNQNQKAPSRDLLPAQSIEGKNQQFGLKLNAVKSFKGTILDERSDIILQPKDKRPSILSGTGTLNELKELSDLLHKSSYIPKQKKTRPSTIVKIKNAIEKAKNEKLTSTANKSQNTIEKVVTMVDTSTLTKKHFVKKKKKMLTDTDTILKSPAGIHLNSSKQSDSNKKKQTIRTKPVQKIDFGVQTSFTINVRRKKLIEK